MEMKSLTIGGKTYDEFNPAAAEMDKKLDKTGGMITGNINMPGKTLLTEKIELKTGNIDGVVMYSESTEANTVNKPVLSLYGSDADQAVTIFNVETPTRPYEAANKKYVDSLYATPNNAPLTFTGAVEATYDGTENVTVNIPSGGGSGKFRVIRQIILSEQTDRVDITVDDDGKTFELSEIYVNALVQSYNDTNEEVTFLPNGGWTTIDPFIPSINKTSKSSDTWKNQMIFHAVFALGGELLAYQLPEGSKTPKSKFMPGRAVLTKVSIVGKFAVGCKFTVIGR